MPRKILTLTLILVAVPLLAWGMVGYGFKAILSGSEVAPPVKTKATGGASFDLSRDRKSLHFHLAVANLSDPTGAQIHLAAKGKEGPVVVTLYPWGPPSKGKAGKFSGVLAEGIITAANLEGPLKGKTLKDLLLEMQLGNTYLQVGTKQHPQGELRGRIVRRPT